MAAANKIQGGDCNMMINNWSEVLKNLPEYLKNEHTYIYAVCTDKVYWLIINNTQDKDIDVSKLLELRVFNENAEYRLIRPTIDTEFYERIKEDTDNIRSEEYYDQWMYLDIDTKKSGDGREVYSISGGKYELPVNQQYDLQIKVRNYIDYDEYGQVKAADWRLAGFGKGDKADGKV